MNALVPTGEVGLSQMELSEITNLSQSSIGINLEYMMSTDIVKYRRQAVAKVYLANYNLLENLFVFMNDNYGSGVSQSIRTRSSKITDDPSA